MDTAETPVTTGAEPQTDKPNAVEEVDLLRVQLAQEQVARLRAELAVAEHAANAQQAALRIRYQLEDGDAVLADRTIRRRG